MGENQVTIEWDNILERVPRFVLREEAGEGGILYDPDTGGIRLLNTSATAFWKAVDGEASLTQVVRNVTGGYDEVAEDAPDQLRKLAARLCEMGALRCR